MLERPAREAAREGIGKLKEFRQFILRGNLVDLAVAVVIGTAFTALVTSLVKNLVTPLIAAIAGKPDFSGLTFTIHGSRFLYGAFFNALLSFVIIAAVVFFLIIKPVNVLMARFQLAPAVDVKTRACPECLSDIPREATRCAFCTARVAPPAPLDPPPRPAE
jgi:large conductance mechanosensitive channel